MKLITDISRYFVGVLFIFSGIIKANDPLGFSYKLEEYFVEFGKLAEHIGFLEAFFSFCHDYALPQAIFIVVLEVILGVAILVRFKTRLTAFLLLVLIAFFTVLTFASAYFGIVKTCGCFGDAIPLTAWESFYKDIILSIFILIIFVRQKQISISETGVNDFILAVVGSLVMLKLAYGLEWYFPFWFTVITFAIFFLVRLVEHRKAPWITTVLATIGMSFFTFYTYSYLPVKDFRAYAIGKKLMVNQEHEDYVFPKIKFYYQLKNKKTGVIEEFEKFPGNYQENWDYAGVREEIVNEGTPLVDIKIDNDEELTMSILYSPEPVFVVVSKDLESSAVQVQEKLNELYDDVHNSGHLFFGLSPNRQEFVEKYRQDYVIPYQFYSADDIALKTIVRSNPGLIVLKEGKVIAKWHHNDIPSFETLEQEFLSED